MKTFIVKNLSNKIINILGMNLIPGQIYDIAKLANVTDQVLDNDVFNGTINKKIMLKEIQIIKNNFEFRGSRDLDDKFGLSDIVLSPNIITESYSWMTRITNFLRISGINSSASDQYLTTGFENKYKYPGPISFNISAPNQPYFPSIFIKGTLVNNEKVTEEFIRTQGSAETQYQYKDIEYIKIPGTSAGGTLTIDPVLGSAYPFSQQPTNIVYASINKKQIQTTANLTQVNNSLLLGSTITESFVPEAAANNSWLLSKSVSSGNIFTTATFDGTVGVKKYLFGEDNSNACSRQITITSDQVITGNIIAEGIDCFNCKFKEQIPISGTTATSYGFYLSLTKITIPSQGVSYNVSIGINNYICPNNLIQHPISGSSATNFLTKLKVDNVDTGFTTLNSYPSFISFISTGLQPNGIRTFTLEYSPSPVRTYAKDYFRNKILVPLKPGSRQPNGSAYVLGLTYSVNILETELSLSITYEF